MKKKDIFLSVIIPVYNCEKYISKCVESLIAQDGDDYEIILIDDGSTDCSSEICKKFEKEYSNIIFLEQKNSGVSSARNRGIENANGRYITFVDSDDYVDYNYFKEIRKIALTKNIEIINFGFISEVQNENGDILSYDNINYLEKYYTSYDQIKNDLIQLWDTHMLYNIWNKIYLKKIIDDNKIRFSKKNFGEDMEFNILFLEKINKFYNSDKCFYHYIKERKGSLTQSFNINLFEIRKDEYHYFNDYFKNNKIKFDDFIEFSSRRFIERVVGCIENICSCSNIKLYNKIKKIKLIINDKDTIIALKYARPHSIKMIIILFPMKIKLTCFVYIMCKFIGTVRKVSPGLFNKLKNKR